MRWFSTPKPVFCDTRVCSKFLWLPKRIGNEWRWLEHASWREKFGICSWWPKEWL